MQLRNHRTQQTHQAATLAWNSQSLRALSTICDTEGKLLRFAMEKVFWQFTKIVLNKTFRLFSYGMIATLRKEHIYLYTYNYTQNIKIKRGVFINGWPFENRFFPELSAELTRQHFKARPVIANLAALRPSGLSQTGNLQFSEAACIMGARHGAPENQ